MKRKSEIVIPDEVDEVFLVKHVASGKTTSILTETGAWNVLTVLATTHKQHEHQLIRVDLS